MAQSRAAIQKAYRDRRRARRAAVKPDAVYLPVSSLGKIIEFCSDFGTLRDWDDNDMRAIARAHERALDVARKLLGLDEEDGNAR
jgi:hypothetical protein